MSDYRKRHRTLKQSIAEIDKHSVKLVKEENVELIGIAIATNRWQRHHYEMELKVLESEKLRAKASK